MKNDSTEVIKEYVRGVARKIKKEQKQKLKEELKLRRQIRKMINEVEEVSPHASTGINVLEDLLKTIIPIIEVGYKRLTTAEEQRESYRSHILRAIQNLLSTESIYFNADKKGKFSKLATADAFLEEADEEPGTENPESESDIEKDPAFIDIEKDKKEKEKVQPKPDDAFQPIAGEDPTGRGFALRSFQKVQKQILDSYSLLGKEEDKDVFYDYLITNAKLYFDKFEDELQNKLEEPTTPEYEAEKQKKQQSISGGAAAGTDVGAAVDAGETAGGAVAAAGEESSEEETGEEETGEEAEEEEELEIELEE